MLCSACTIPIVAGIFSIFVIAAHFATFHTTALHVDSADQSVAIANNSKIKKNLPILIAIFASVFEKVVPAPVFFVIVQEWSPAGLFKNSHLSSRAPP
jgi:hypothetical protein